MLPEEVSIEIAEDALRRYNLSFSEVAQAIRQSSLNSSGGQIRSNVGDVSMTARALADTQEQFENIIVRQSNDQGTIRVGDVAQVIDGFVDADLDATHNGKPDGVCFGRTADKMDIVNYADSFRDYIDRANNPATGILPDGMQIEILWDNSQPFQARMQLISESALLGAVW